MVTNLPFAVFILRDGHWHAHSEHGGPENARQERDYLTDMLGLVAQVFRRKVS